MDKETFNEVAQWKLLLFTGFVAFGIGFLIAYTLLEPEVDTGITDKIEELKALNDRLDEEIEELYLRIDSTDAYYEQKSLDWQNEANETTIRNTVYIPAEAKRINQADVGDQLLYLKSLRDSADSR